MKKLALIGSKEFAQQIRCFVEEMEDLVVVGYFDDYAEVGTIVCGLPILGHTDHIIDVFEAHLFDCLFIAVGYSSFQFRESIFLKHQGIIPFVNIISPSAVISSTASLGEGVFIGPDSLIGDHVIIHDNVFIHGSSCIGHDNVIGDHTYISGRFDSAGFVRIGARNFIGIRVMFSDHVTVCDDVWIGLGCIVAKDIKEAGKYMSPAAKLYKIE